MNSQIIFGLGVLIGALSCVCSQEYALPSYMKACPFGSTFGDCVRAQIQESLNHFTKGVPEMDVPPIDPIHLDDINIDGNGLKLKFSHPALNGIAQSIVTDFKVSLDDESFELAFKCNFVLKAKYTVDGRILILPIQGKGDATVRADNVNVVIKSKLLHTKDTKGDHLKLSTPNYSYTIGKTSFKFENLFNGNKELSDATHTFANENWKQIMDDLSPPVIKQIVKTAVKTINKFFSKLTVQQMIIGYVPKN